MLRGCLVTGRKTPSHGSDEGPQGGSHETGVDVFYAGKARELSERGQGPGGSGVTSSGSWDAWGPRLGGGTPSSGLGGAWGCTGFARRKRSGGDLGPEMAPSCAVR